MLLKEGMGIQLGPLKKVLRASIALRYSLRHGMALEWCLYSSQEEKSHYDKYYLQTYQSHFLHFEEIN